jgi:predicted GIY-YIG superfamily endonuclease
MESFTQAAQKFTQSPVVKRLRTLEQSKASRGAARRERMSKTLQGIDRAVKLEIAERAKSQAADLAELAKIFEEDAGQE